MNRTFDKLIGVPIRHDHAEVASLSSEIDALSSNAVLLVGDQSVNGRKTFTDSVTVSGSIVVGQRVQCFTNFSNQFEMKNTSSAGLGTFLIENNIGISRALKILNAGSSYAGTSFLNDLSGAPITEPNATCISNAYNAPMYLGTNGHAVACIYDDSFGVGLFNLANKPSLGFETRGISSVFNSGNGDFDFTIMKNVSGSAYVYDAGNDSHVFGSSSVAVTRSTEEQQVASVKSLTAQPTPTTAGKKGEIGTYGAFAYIWIDDAVVVRSVIQTTW